MQEFKDNDVVSSVELDDDAESTMGRLAISMRKMADGEIDHVRIGRVPEKNEAIEVNGLRYVVEASGQGRFTASLHQPKG